MDRNWLESIAEKTQLTQVIETNSFTKQFGLVLSDEDAQLIVAERKNVLREQRRVEFGESMTKKLIFAFCDSDYIRQDTYRETLIRLQEIFYLFKNEMMDEITDDELLQFMREQFDGVCFGDLDYLEQTCLPIFAEAIRAGYREYHLSGGKGEFAKIDMVQRWDRELFLQTLKELFWE